MSAFCIYREKEMKICLVCGAAFWTQGGLAAHPCIGYNPTLILDETPTLIKERWGKQTTDNTMLFNSTNKKEV